MSVMGPENQFPAELGRRLLCPKPPRSVEEQRGVAAEDSVAKVECKLPQGVFHLQSRRRG